MNKLVPAMILSVIVITPVMAMQKATTQLDDTRLIFQSDQQPLELEPLSQKEMTETEGAVVPIVVVASVVGQGALAGIGYWKGTDKPNASGLAVAVGSGMAGGAAGGFIGAGISTFGALYGSQIRSTGKPNLACTGTPCILPK
jgi:hypothetical protein